MYAAVSLSNATLSSLCMKNRDCPDNFCLRDRYAGNPLPASIVTCPYFPLRNDASLRIGFESLGYLCDFVNGTINGDPVDNDVWIITVCLREGAHWAVATSNLGKPLDLCKLIH